jgi:hypothetical protein
MKNTLLALILGLAASLPSFAGSPAKAPIAPPNEEVRRAITYDFVEAGYASILSHDAGDFYGGYLNLSVSPVSNLYLFARAYVFSGDGDGLDLSAGAGTYIPLFRDFDFILEAGYNYFELESDGVNSVFVSPGFRAMLTSRLELNGNATVTFPDEGDTSVAVGGGIVYYLSPTIGLTAGYYYDIEDQSHFYQAGVRYLW